MNEMEAPILFISNNYYKNMSLKSLYFNIIYFIYLLKLNEIKTIMERGYAFQNSYFL